MSEQYWLEAEMIKTWDKANKAFNAGYRKGMTVFVLNTPINDDGTKLWRVFNGSHHYGVIDMTTEEAKQYLKTKRVQGKTVKARDQKGIDDQYNWMMWS